MAKARDIFFPFLTTLTLASFMVFVSCASKETVEDEYTQEEGSVEGDTASNEETTNPESSDLTAESSNADGLEKLEDTNAEQQSTVSNSVNGSAKDDMASLNEAPPLPEKTPAAVPPAENLEELKKMMDAGEKPAPRAARSRARVASVGRLPHISDNAIEKKGQLLNRFYFVRKGDTPPRVSALLYGAPNRANEIVAWNGKRRDWKTGRLIYYVSPFNPQDTKMQSFYQERSVAPEEYKVKRWDWLSKIAKVRLGDARSWQEVAIVSGIENPNNLEVGRRLILYPVDLTPYSADKVSNAQTAQADPTPAPPVAQAAVPTEPAQAAVPEVVPPVVTEPPAPVAEAPPSAPSKKASSSKKGGLDIAKLLEQNAVFGLFAAVALPIVILLVFVNKRRRNKRQEDAGEDPFSSSAPKKAKR